METIYFEKTIRLGRDKEELARQLQCSNVEVWEADLEVESARRNLTNGGTLKDYRRALINLRRKEIRSLELYHQLEAKAN